MYYTEYFSSGFSHHFFTFHIICLVMYFMYLYTIFFNDLYSLYNMFYVAILNKFLGDYF